MSNQVNFASITTEAALDALVALDVAKWGEGEREAARKMHSGKSRGLLINSIVHHQGNDFGDAFDAATKKTAKQQLTADDLASLRKGG